MDDADTTRPAEPEARVREVVEGIMSAWLRCDADALNAFYDDDVVVRGPDFLVRSRGRTEGVAGDRAFLEAARIDAFEHSDHSIDVVGTTAVATYRWAMTYTLAGETYSERGRDLFVLADGERGPRIVWRVMTVDPG